MIAYDLNCVNGHTFEGWFDNENAYMEQRDKGLISCPICNETDILRIPSTFAIKSAGSSSPAQKKEVPTEMIVQKLYEFVENNFDNVGCDFAKEALKIHYGASEPRNIRGSSTEEEEKMLKEEGIDFVKIPVPVKSETDA